MACRPRLTPQRGETVVAKRRPREFALDLSIGGVQIYGFFGAGRSDCSNACRNTPKPFSASGRAVAAVVSSSNTIHALQSAFRNAATTAGIFKRPSPSGGR